MRPRMSSGQANHSGELPHRSVDKNGGHDERERNAPSSNPTIILRRNGQEAENHKKSFREAETPEKSTGQGATTWRYRNQTETISIETRTRTHSIMTYKQTSISPTVL